MRASLAALAVCTSALAFAAEDTRQPAAEVRAALPRDEAALRDLDLRQLQILRRSLRGCGASYPSGRAVSAFRDPCVTRWTDQTVEAAQDPALLAFHHALPARVRYDEARSSAAWRRWATAGD